MDLTSNKAAISQHDKHYCRLEDTPEKACFTREYKDALI